MTGGIHANGQNKPFSPHSFVSPRDDIRGRGSHGGSRRAESPSLSVRKALRLPFLTATCGLSAHTDAPIDHPRHAA